MTMVVVMILSLYLCIHLTLKQFFMVSPIFLYLIKLLEEVTPETDKVPTIDTDWYDTPKE